MPHYAWKWWGLRICPYLCEGLVIKSISFSVPRPLVWKSHWFLSVFTRGSYNPETIDFSSLGKTWAGQLGLITVEGKGIGGSGWPTGRLGLSVSGKVLEQKALPRVGGKMQWGGGLTVMSICSELEDGRVERQPESTRHRKSQDIIEDKGIVIFATC